MQPFLGGGPRVVGGIPSIRSVCIIFYMSSEIAVLQFVATPRECERDSCARK